MRLMFFSLICLLIGSVGLKANEKHGRHSSYYAANDGKFENKLQHEMKDKGPNRFNLKKRKKMQKERKQVERFRLLKLLELLDLDDEIEGEFITLFRSYRKKQNHMRKEKAKTINRLADGLRTNTIIESEINELVTDILMINEEKLNLEQQFYKETDNILTPQQLGKLYVFQARFEMEVLGHMANLKRRRKNFPPLENMFEDKPLLEKKQINFIE